MPRHRSPRQSEPQSSLGTLTSTSIALDTQISTTISATDLASSISSSSATNTGTSQITTTSSSTETTSTSQSPATSPTTSSVLTTTSFASTSSFSTTLRHTTSSAASTSSPVLPSSTTQPPTPSFLQQGAQTTITSSYTVYVNGSPSITSTAYPSTIPESSSQSSSSERSAIIGGSAVGGAAVIIILLSIAFWTRRKRFKRLAFLDRITRKRKQAYTRANLLDGEDLDDVDLARSPPRYTDYQTPWDTRGSETRSALREDLPHEGTRLMDSLATRDDVDLGRIVDDVMGPRSEPLAMFSDQSVSSMHRVSVADTDGAAHSRTVSNASNAALLDFAGLPRTSSGAALSSMGPVRPSPLAQPESRQATDAS